MKTMIFNLLIPSPCPLSLWKLISLLVDIHPKAYICFCH